MIGTNVLLNMHQRPINDGDAPARAACFLTCGPANVGSLDIGENAKTPNSSDDLGKEHKALLNDLQTENIAIKRV